MSTVDLKDLVKAPGYGARSASEGEMGDTFSMMKKVDLGMLICKCIYEGYHAYLRAYENAKAYSALTVEQTEELHQRIDEWWMSKITTMKKSLDWKRKRESSGLPVNLADGPNAGGRATRVIQLLTGVNLGEPSDDTRADENTIEVFSDKEEKIVKSEIHAIQEELGKLRAKMTETYIFWNTHRQTLKHFESIWAAFPGDTFLLFVMQIITIVFTWNS